MFAWISNLLHHAEAVDPDLVDRIRHEIDAITGFEPSTIVLLIGLLIVIFPIAMLTLFALRMHRRARAHAIDGPDGAAS